MENKKVFIGNLNFEVTEGDLKKLLTQFGTVVNVRMYQKKGYAFAEMGNADEAANVIRKLDGTIYKEREINASLELRPGKAKSVSVKKYKERGAKFSKEKSGEISEYETRRGKHNGSVKSVSGNNDRNRPSSRSYSKSKNESDREEKTSSEYVKAEYRPRVQKRDIWATEKPDDSNEFRRKDLSSDKKPYQGRKPQRDDTENSLRDSRDESGSKSEERSTVKGNRPLRDYTKESSRKPVYTRKKPALDKPDYSAKQSRDGEKPDYGRSRGTGTGKQSRERSSGSSDRPDRGYTKDINRSSNSSKREWTKEKPSGSQKKINDSWREKPEKKDVPAFEKREYSKPKSVSGSQNRFSKTSRPKTGDSGRSFTGSSGKKRQTGAVKSGTKKRYDRD